MSLFGGGNVEFTFEHGEFEVPVRHPDREVHPHHHRPGLKGALWGEEVD